MPSVSSVGVGSGVLTSKLVDDLIAVERESTDKRLAAEEENFTAQVTELGKISSAADKLKSTATSLTLASSFESNTTSTTDDNVLTATASSFARPGIYNIETLQLAQSQSIASKEYDDLNDIVGQGKLVFNFGNVDTTIGAGKTVTSFDSFTENEDKASRTISITSANHTLSDVRDTVNKANIGVTASIVDTGSGFRLLFESTDSGDTNGFTITATGAANGLDDLNFNENDHGDMLHTADAKDSEIKVNGLTVTRESNLVTGVINGITLNLKDTSDDGPVSLTVEPDTATITKRMDDFIGAYNELKSLTNELTKYDTEQQQGSLFTGDATLRGMDAQLKRILSSSLSTTVGGDVRSLSEIGIKTDSTSGTLTFDSGEFNKYIRSSPESLTKLFGTTGSGATNVDYIRGQTNTKAGDYDVVITKLATKAKLEGNSNPAGGGNFIINQNNDGFGIKVNGKQSATIEIANGSYTGEQLATLLESKINADETLKKGAASVSVVFDSSDNSFSVESSSYGDKSSVAFSSMDKDFAETLGLHLTGQGPRTLNSVEGLTSTDALSAAVVIDNTNNSLTMTVDGVSSETIEIAEGSYANGKELALAIQAAINSDSKFVAAGINSIVNFSADQEAGQFDINFNQQRTYTINSADAGLTNTAGIQANVSSTEQVTDLKVADTFASAVTVDDNNDKFNIQVGSIGGRYFEDVTIAQGTYANGADLATAVAAAINEKTNIAEPAKLVMTNINLDSPIDYAADPKGIVLALADGVEHKININQNATVDLNGDSTVDAQDNVYAIQAAIDAAMGAGKVTAAYEDGKFSLTTVAEGDVSLRVVDDGIKATSVVGTTVVSNSEDFTGATDATLGLTLNSHAISIDLGDVDLTDVNSDTLLETVQAKLDVALNDNADLNAGDIVAMQSADDKIYFVSKNSGDDQALTISSIGAADVLGLTAGLNNTANGVDGIGLAEIKVSGLKAHEAVVTYDGGTANGGLNISFGNGVGFDISGADSASASTLGIKNDDGSQHKAVTGSDVEGTINGVTAVSSGQRLTGAKENDAEGLSLFIQGDSVGNRGRVNFNMGIAEQLERFIESYLSANGALGEKRSGMQNSLEQIGLEKADLEVRMTARRESLSRQFTFYDTMVSRLNNTKDFLKSNFDAWNSVRNS